MAENNVRTLKVRLFTTKVIKSHVKLHVKSNATKIPRESTPYITLTLQIFSACCNTSRGIKLTASQADRLRSACSLAINTAGKSALKLGNLPSLKIIRQKRDYAAKRLEILRKFVCCMVWGHELVPHQTNVCKIRRLCGAVSLLAFNKSRSNLSSSLILS